MKVHKKANECMALVCCKMSGNEHDFVTERLKTEISVGFFSPLYLRFRKEGREEGFGNW